MILLGACDSATTAAQATKATNAYCAQGADACETTLTYIMHSFSVYETGTYEYIITESLKQA